MTRLIKALGIAVMAGDILFLLSCLLTATYLDDNACFIATGVFLWGAALFIAPWAMENA